MSTCARSTASSPTWSPAAAPARDADDVVQGDGGALLPGLHDHHLNLLDAATRSSSVACGTGSVSTLDDLSRALRAAPGVGWVRGADYDESVAGRLDRHVLDVLLPDRPRLGAPTATATTRSSTAAPSPSCATSSATRPPSSATSGACRPVGCGVTTSTSTVSSPARRPTLTRFGRILAGHGITGVTDATPFLDAAATGALSDAAARGALPRTILLGVDRRCHAPRAPQHRTLDAAPARRLAAHLPGARGRRPRRPRHRPRRRRLRARPPRPSSSPLGVFDAVGRLNGDRIELATQVTADQAERLVGFAVIARPRPPGPADPVRQRPPGQATGSGAPRTSSTRGARWPTRPRPFRTRASPAPAAPCTATCAPPTPRAPCPRRVAVGERANLVLLDSPLAQVLSHLGAGETVHPVVSAYEATGVLPVEATTLPHHEHALAV